MKVLHINTFNTGGAAHACLRLHQGLLEAGVDSNVLLLYKTRNELAKVVDFRSYTSRTSVRYYDKIKNKLKTWKDELKLMPLPAQNEYFSFPESTWDITLHPLYASADVIHLHWVAGFLDYPSFFSKCSKPIVWTLHDFGSFTGGFHYEWGVDKKAYADLLERNLSIKKKAISSYRQPLHIVCPSQYLTDKSMSSSVFEALPHTTIHHSIGTNTYTYMNKQTAKSELGLNTDKHVVLFIADGLAYSRKGFDDFIVATETIDAQIVVVGNKKQDRLLRTDTIRYMGLIQDMAILNKIYAAAEVYVNPSHADISSLTTMEALAGQGTPVVCYATGGIPELVSEGENAILCRKSTPAELKNSIVQALETKYDYRAISAQAHKSFSSIEQGRQSI